MPFGQDPKAVEAITREAVKAHAKQPVIMKLSPNVTDITVMAKAAEAGGADATLPDQHFNRNENRYPPENLRRGQQDRRTLRSGDPVLWLSAWYIR